MAKRQFFNRGRRRFISSFLGNIGVLLLSAGALSEPFVAFPKAVKAVIIVWGLICFVTGVLVAPDDEEEES